MLTVKQIADRAGVSKTTVTRYLKRIESTSGNEYIKHNTSTDEAGRTVISEELSDQLHEIILKQKELQQGTTPPQHEPPHTATDRNTPVAVCSETDCNRTATQCNTPLQQGTTDHNTEPPHPATGPQQGATPETIAALNRVIETQQAQIEQLKQDKHDLKENYETQIQRAEQDKANLQKQIDQLNILLSQQQQIHQTLQVKLLETEQTQETDEAEPAGQPKKKRRFGIFGKK